MQDSVERFIESLSPYLSSQLCSLGYKGCATETEDLLQEIRIRVWKTFMNKGKNIRHPKAYIKKIVFSVFINEINRQKKEKRVLQLAEDDLNRNSETNSDCPLPHGLLNDILMTSLGMLRKTTRHVIKLHFEGLSLPEIARLNGWSYKKACNVYYRGIEELKGKLLEKGIHLEN